MPLRVHWTGHHSPLTKEGRRSNLAPPSAAQSDSGERMGIGLVRRVGLIVLAMVPLVESVHARSPRQDIPIDTDIVVRITSPRAGDRVSRRFVITGFALDRRTPENPGLNERDVQIWLSDSSETPNLLGYAAPTPDVLD